MIDVRVEGDREIVADFAAYPVKSKNATVRALNRGMTSGQTVMARLIAKDAGLKVGDVKKALKFRKATWAAPVARLGASLKRTPLIAFGAKGNYPSMGRGRGVTYKGAGGQRRRLPQAFIARMPSGHEGVFKRKGKTRLPIVELQGPSLAQVFAKYRKDGLAAAHASFEKTYEHEMNFRKDAPADAGAD